MNHPYFYSSGKLFPMSTESIPLAPTMETVISSLSASMSTTMRPPVANMSHALFWSILNQVPWTLYDQDPMDKFSGQITLSLDSREQETTGQRDITQKVIIFVKVKIL